MSIFRQTDHYKFLSKNTVAVRENLHIVSVIVVDMNEATGGDCDLFRGIVSLVSSDNPDEDQSDGHMQDLCQIDDEDVDEVLNSALGWAEQYISRFDQEMIDIKVKKYTSPNQLAVTGEIDGIGKATVYSDMVFDFSGLNKMGWGDPRWELSLWSGGFNANDLIKLDALVDFLKKGVEQVDKMIEGSE